MKRFGEIVAEAMAAKGINQSELARMCGVSRQSINRMLIGHVQNPSLPVANRICKALSLDLDEVCDIMEED